MGTHKIASNKIKELTARLEKSLYKLKYGDMDVTPMDKKFYDKVKCICEANGYPFPLITQCGEILVECDTSQVFCTLSKLADDHGIVIDTKKTTT